MALNKTTAIVRFGVFEANLQTKELRKHGMRLKLPGQPFQILELLLEQPGELVTREEIRQKLWPADTFVDFDHSLNSAMKKLREMLSDSASSPRFIETLAKRGYRFIAPVEAAATAGSGSETGAPEDFGSAMSRDSDFPKLNRTLARFLFSLLQIMYLLFYAFALSKVDIVNVRFAAIFGSIGVWIAAAMAVSALVGIPARLYLLTAVALDYHRFSEKYGRLWPFLFALDLLWSLAPLLIEMKIGIGLALAAIAPLLYSPFAQRVLVISAYRPSE